MGSPKMGEGGQVLDPGVDLNMEGGLAEHAKVKDSEISQECRFGILE
jgi:hypothetical protein